MVVKFEVDGKAYGLYFGIPSTRIFEEKCAAEYLRLQASGIAEPDKSDFDPYLTFAFLIHSGLCNMADINTDQKPDFIDSYTISQTISKDESLSKKIHDVWHESQPVKDMLERLAQINKEQKKSPRKAIGTKSKPTPSVS